MKNLIILFAPMYLFLVGCSEIQTMPLNSSNVSSINLENESLVVLKMNIINDYKPDFRPQINFIDFVGDKKHRFSVSFDEAEKIGENGNSYLLNANIPPGKYRYLVIHGNANHLLFFGKFRIIADLNSNINAGNITYIGELTAINKEKVYDYQKRSGPIFPLIDQAISGFSGGTFELTWLDKYEDNIKEFSERYSTLLNKKIEKIKNYSVDGIDVDNN